MTAVSLNLAATTSVATVHHFACTGGTVISRCIAALPNTRLLSEVDPLSNKGLEGELFRPTDVIGLSVQGAHPISIAARAAMFRAASIELLKDSRKKGLSLVFRDHAHSQFCVKAASQDRPTLYELLCEVFQVSGVVTVRHPIESFISLQKNRWVEFCPPTLDEYSCRYIDFLDRHTGLPIMQYEKFTYEPEQWLREIAGHLGLSFNPLAVFLGSAIRLSGDSGRSGSLVAPRPPKPFSVEMQKEAASSRAYEDLAERLGYS